VDGEVVEVHWLGVYAALALICAPIFVAIGIAATISLAASPGLLGTLWIVVAAAVDLLLGLLGAAGLWFGSHWLRRVPAVRLDDRGIVWGADRSRDLSIDWGDIAGVSVRVVRGNPRVPFAGHLIIIDPQPSHRPRSTLTTAARISAVGNRFAFDTPYVIGTAFLDRSASTLLPVIFRHVPGRPLDDVTGEPL
jgi:hypothetical protein